MPNIKAVVIRRPTPFDGSGNTAYITGMTNRIMTTPKRVNVVQEGLRASDNMSMTLSAEHDVQQNDEIYYIQDFLDTSSLKAVWNFYGGFRDESGYEHDDVLDSNDEHVMPNCVDSTVSSDTDMDSRYKGYYKFKINALSSSKTSVEIIKQFKNNNTTSSKIPVMDMSGDFDMIFHFKSLTNSSSYNNMCIFDNYDHATSGGKGLKVNINSNSNTITITADDGTTEKIMVASSVPTYNVITFVRIKRESGVFKLYLDGVEKSLTNSTLAGNLNNNVNIHLFKEKNESTGAYSNGFFGIPIQFRFYTGSLPDSEVKKLRMAKPVNTTMKFGGKIWKIDQGSGGKKLSCASHSRELLGTNFSQWNYSNVPTDNAIGYGNYVGSRVYNLYQKGITTLQRIRMDAILEDILKFIPVAAGAYSYFADEPSTTFVGDFLAEGSLLDIIKVMMQCDTTKHMFVVTPRKILFINEEVVTNNVISEHNYDIISSGKDDTGTCNSIVVHGRKQIYTETKTLSNLASSARYTWTAKQQWTAPDGYYPVIERAVKVTRDGTEIFAQPNKNINGYWQGTGSDVSYTDNTYIINTDNTMQFWNQDDANSHTYIVIYEYTYTYSLNLVTQSGVIWASTQHKLDYGSTLAIGIYHRNIHVPQLYNGLDVATFKNNYISENKTINTRLRAKTSTLINSLTVGQKVRYTNRDGVTTDQIVRYIEYSYPDGNTTIELGEYMFSGFDVEKQTVESLRVLDQTTSVSKY